MNPPENGTDMADQKEIYNFLQSMRDVNKKADVLCFASSATLSRCLSARVFVKYEVSFKNVMLS